MEYESIAAADQRAIIFSLRKEPSLDVGQFTLQPPSLNAAIRQKIHEVAQGMHAEAQKRWVVKRFGIHKVTAVYTWYIESRTLKATEARPVPDLPPPTMPLAFQLQLLERAMKLLEAACWSFTEDREELKEARLENGWDCAESIDLCTWVPCARTRMKAYFEQISGDANWTDSLVQVVNLRNAVCHKNRPMAEAVENYLAHAAQLARLMRATKVQDDIAALRQQAEDWVKVANQRQAEVQEDFRERALSFLHQKKDNEKQRKRLADELMAIENAERENLKMMQRQDPICLTCPSKNPAERKPGLALLRAVAAEEKMKSTGPASQGHHLDATTGPGETRDKEVGPTAPKDPKTDGQQREANGLDHLAQERTETHQKPPEESKNTKKKRKKLTNKDKSHSTTQEDGLQGPSLTYEGAVPDFGLPVTTQGAVIQPGKRTQVQPEEDLSTTKSCDEQKLLPAGALRIIFGNHDAERSMRNNEEAGRNCSRHEPATGDSQTGTITTTSHRSARECEITKVAPLRSPTAKEVPATSCKETEAGHAVSGDDAAAQIDNVKSLDNYGPGIVRWLLS